MATLNKRCNFFPLFIFCGTYYLQNATHDWKKDELDGFSTINGKTKIKIDDETTTKVVSHDVGLMKIFEEETMEAIENKQVSQD